MVLLITAVGFTLAVTFKAVPAHPFTDGVTTYTTFTGFKVLLTNVSLIVSVDPLPVAGLIPVTNARVQVNVAVVLVLVAV